MRYLIVKLIVGIILLGTATNVLAVVVTETWESTITSIDHSVYSVGDTFQWTVTYNNESNEMHRWNDGANGIGEAGAGDDTINFTWNLISYPSYTTFSDAVFNVSSFYDRLSAASMVGRDVRSWNQARASNGGTTTSYQYRNLIVDDLYFTLDQAQTYYYDTSGNSRLSRTQYSSALIATTLAVPEPSVIALLALGIVGIGFSGRKVSST